MAILEKSLRSGILDDLPVHEDQQKHPAQNTQSLPNDKGEQSLLEKVMTFKVETGPSRKDILTFTNQLSVMVKAGISLQESLESIGNQIEKVKFKRIILDLKAKIESGHSFSQALAEHPKYFGKIYVNMIAAAEISGSLSTMLQQLAEYLDQEAETRSQVIGAMIYPAIIAFMAVSCTSFLMMFVLPRFLTVFEGKEHLLPAPTKIVMHVSGFMRGYWHVNLVGLIVLITGFLFFIKTDTGERFWHTAKLKIPLLRTLCRSLYITRSLHTMGVLTNAGVPILDTISITASITGNVLYEEMWRSVYTEVRQGRKIACSLSTSTLMPASVSQMISSGEESGTLGIVLSDISEFYGRELKTVIKMVTSMIEPIMIVVMGALVGFIASSIILPIFKMSSAVSG